MKILTKINLLLNLLLLGSTGYFIYTLLLLDGIEDLLRYLFIAMLVVVFLLSFISIKSINKKNIIKRFFYYIFILGMIFGQFVAAYNISRFYTTIDKISKNTTTYSTSLIVLQKSTVTKDTIKDLKIGMISDTNSIDGYKLSKEIISEQKLSTNNTIKEYDDYFTMLQDMYDKKLDAIFVPSNYESMFKTTDDFQYIGTETKVILTKEKEVKKANVTTSGKKLTEPFTVLIMGIDSVATDIKNANSNGDSLMLVSFNPKTLNVTILSIPRDTYVPIACFPNQKKNKITHAGWYGEQCMEETIENFTGIEIDYYVKIDFKGVVDLVEILGGINVDVPMNFCEQDSARSFENEICLKTGYQSLNGEEALALARHRHSLTTGDLQRGINQQLVVEGIMAQLKSVKDTNQLYNILTAIESHVDTNISTSQILSLYSVGKDIILRSLSQTDSIVSMQQLYLEGYSQRIYDSSFGKELYNYVYYKNSMVKIANAIETNLGIKNAELIKEFSFAIDENYEKDIIGKGITGGDTLDLVPSFIGKTKSYVESWANARNISVTYTYVDKSAPFVQDNVVDQSVAIKSDSSTIKSMNIKLANIIVVQKVLKEYKLKSDDEKTITIEEYKELPEEETTGDENDQTDYEAVYE